MKTSKIDFQKMYYKKQQVDVNFICLKIITALRQNRMFYSKMNQYIVQSVRIYTNWRKFSQNKYPEILKEFDKENNPKLDFSKISPADDRL